jgi:hypothetical protein
MKKIAIVIGVLLVIIGLVETIDLSFYLMNRPDTYLFNLGLVLFGLQLFFVWMQGARGRQLSWAKGKWKSFEEFQIRLKILNKVIIIFMVFAFIIALAITAYMSSKTPIYFVVHLLFTVLMTYFCILLSNMYRELLTNPFINSIMVDFVIYNKLMFFLPQILFFTSLVFGVISFINIIKPQNPDASSGVNYGGDY